MIYQVRALCVSTLKNAHVGPAEETAASVAGQHQDLDDHLWAAWEQHAPPVATLQPRDRDPGLPDVDWVPSTVWGRQAGIASVSRRRVTQTKKQTVFLNDTE